MITEAQIEEFKKCHNDFKYFCQYLKIIHPTKGLIIFQPYDYQLRLANHYADNRFTILKKFRNGGFSTTTTLWALWNCLFKVDQRFFFMSYSKEYLKELKKFVSVAIEFLPAMFKPELKRNNAHEIDFADTGSYMIFMTPEAARGRGIDWLIIEEAAFIKKMEDNWKAMYPCLSCGGKAIALSTVNGPKGWFYDNYNAARRGFNNWKIFENSYTEHPDYQNKEWEADLKAQLGGEGWKQEVLAEF